MKSFYFKYHLILEEKMKKSDTIKVDQKAELTPPQSEVHEIHKKKFSLNFFKKKNKDSTPPPNKKKKLTKKRVIAIISIVLILLVLRSCFAGNSKTLNTTSYRLEPVTRRDITVSVKGTATIEPIESYSVTALVKGDILEAPFEEGAIIKKGALLYKIDAKDMDQTVNQAESSISSSETAVKQAEYSVVNAQQGYESQLRIINDLTVKSKYSGKITKVYVDPSDTVNAGTKIADILESSSMLLKLPFHSNDANQLYIGQLATVTMTSTGEKLTGSITNISSVENVGIGGILTREVTISVANPGGITPSSYATAVCSSYSCASSGTFEYTTEKSIFAETNGEVKTINSIEGSSVYVGKPIITMKNDDFEDQLKSAKRALETAKLSLESSKDNLETAKKNYEILQETLKDYEITSPISGTIIEKNYKVGDTIDATSSSNSNSMAVIYDMSTLTFTMNIDELDISKIKLNQEVSITADSVPNKTFTGYVDKINIKGTTTNGVTSYPVTIKINTPEDLLPGMNISAEIFVESVKNVLSIPSEAVSRGNTVLIESPESKADIENNIPEGYQRITVELGKNNEDYIEITSGLKEGQNVAIEVITTDFMSGFNSMGHGSSEPDSEKPKE